MESRNSGRRCAQKMNERQCGLVLSTVPDNLVGTK